MLLLQTNVNSNLDAFDVSFGYSLNSRQTCSLWDHIPAVLPRSGPWAIIVARRQHESRKRKAPK
jgi:hypothetical protein